MTRILTPDAPGLSGLSPAAKASTDVDLEANGRGSAAAPLALPLSSRVPTVTRVADKTGRDFGRMEPVVAKPWVSALSAARTSAKARFAFAIVAMALLVSSRRSLAHTPGISTADFDVQPDARVQARLTFASAELLASLALDRDHDGIVTDADPIA